MNPEHYIVIAYLKSFLDRASALDHSCQPNAVAVFQGKEISVRLVENLPSDATLSDVRNAFDSYLIIQLYYNVY